MRTNTTSSKVFPPPLIIGSRVWTESGYKAHGPREGPKVDIPEHLGGTIVSTEQPYYTMDQLLYSVRWDSGQLSKHYAKELFGIGRFMTRTEFEAAIKPLGPVELILGPQGGIRQARLTVEYDGCHQLCEIDRALWLACIERIVKNAGLEVVSNKLSPRLRVSR